MNFWDNYWDKYCVVWSKGLRIFLVMLIVPLILNTYSISQVYAAESSPSADIKAKLEDLKQEIASKAAQLKKEVNQKLQNKVYVGTIKSKAENTIIINSRTGLKTINVNDSTVFENTTPKKGKPSLQTLAAGSSVAALGDIDDVGVMTAKKVVLLSSQEPPAKQHLWGQIISKTEELLTLKDRQLNTHAISVNSSTQITRGSKKDDNLRINDFVIVIGYLGKEVLEAEMIYIIPQGGVLKPKAKLATPSAQKATSSAKKKGG